MELGFVAVAALALFLVLRRGRELFCLSIRDGRVLLVRGRLPGALLREVRELVEQVKKGTIRGLFDGDRARLECSAELNEGLAQRLRNTFALYPMAVLRGAPPAANRNLGQRLGIGWLAWMLDSAGE